MKNPTCFTWLARCSKGQITQRRSWQLVNVNLCSPQKRRLDKSSKKIIETAPVLLQSFHPKTIQTSSRAKLHHFVRTRKPPCTQSWMKPYINLPSDEHNLLTLSRQSLPIIPAKISSCSCVLHTSEHSQQQTPGNSKFAGVLYYFKRLTQPVTVLSLIKTQTI